MSFLGSLTRTMQQASSVRPASQPRALYSGGACAVLAQPSQSDPKSCHWILVILQRDSHCPFSKLLVLLLVQTSTCHPPINPPPGKHLPCASPVWAPECRGEHDGIPPLTEFTLPPPPPRPVHIITCCLPPRKNLSGSQGGRHHLRLPN